MVEVLLVDDHTIFRAGLIRLLDEEPQITSITEAADGNAALEQIRAKRFDVVLLDINLPVRSGLELIEPIHRLAPNLPVLVLSMYSATQYALRAFESGAQGYVSKDMESTELVAAITKVVRGGKYITPEVAEKMLEKIDAYHGDDRHLELSNREFAVMVRIASGTSLTATAEELHLSVKTVSTYRSRLLRKMGLDNNAALIHYAIRNRLID